MNYRIILGICIALLFQSLQLQAQPKLPNIGTITTNGINVLSWLNPYTSGVTSVSVQRSADSTFSYQTIGLVTKIHEDKQQFIDSRPLLGNNWYRIIVLFNSGVKWTSNVVKLTIDSTDIINRKPLLSNDTLQKLLADMKMLSPEQTAKDLSAQAAYPKSKYVFTNPFTGNIDINLSDALSNHYTLYFYNQSGEQVLLIPRINDTSVILDKLNFQKSGMFKFKLLKNKKKFATGYVMIY